MNSIFVIVASIVAAVGYAQPIVNPSNLATYLPSEALVGSTDGLDFGVPGADRVWDFSRLELTPAGTNDILLSSETSLAKHFPTATFCTAYTNDSCKAYAYYTCKSDKIEWVGESFTCLDEIDHATNPKTYITFPYTYNTVIRDDFKSGSAQAFSFVSTYDAYGTLVMPYGTHHNVIHQRIVHNGQTDYIWFNTNPFYPIIQTAMADHTMGVTMNTEPRSDFEPDQSFSVIQNLNGILSIYTIQAVEAEITIYDLVGKSMASQKMNGTSTQINLQHCEAGVYFVKMKTNQRNSLQKIEKCSSANLSRIADDGNSYAEYR